MRRRAPLVTISQAIASLQKLQTKYGDLPILIRDYDSDYLIRIKGFVHQQMCDDGKHQGCLVPEHIIISTEPPTR